MDIHLDRLPVIGNPLAEHVLVEFMDYTCKHCRRLHPMMTEALDRYGQQMAIVVRPVALSHKCNPHMTETHRQHTRACDYAKLAIAVWHAEPAKFPEFHHWLMESEKIPSVYDAKSHALDLAGDNVLLKGIDSVAVREMLNENNNTYHLFKKGLPVVLCDIGSFSGVPKSKEAFFEVLEKNLGFRPLKSTLAE